ncbi:MAG: DUF3137 domain-containing protein [Alphaproteobacteria bacterium]|nr:DUF3137 domain-containing protein [Alphaproteobacteria bacterium]MCD8570038.1 DUF3137 domain-containing protein [Alphaproteobacteria bacterium]
MPDSQVIALDSDEHIKEIRPAEDAVFTRQIEEITKRAEDFRMEKMRRYSGRTGVSLIVGMLAMLAGASGFGWYFLMEGHLPKALGCIVIALAVPAWLHYWAGGPIRTYQQEFKTKFMPDLAKALGGLRFFPKRGISENLVRRSGIIPAFDDYRAEDCFMGRYGGVKIILSEARLSLKKRPVFDGIFALLDIENGHFEGTTIITADPALQRSASKTLTNCPISHGVYAQKLSVFTNIPNHPSKLAADENLLKEIYEMSVLFDDAPLTAIFWNKRTIFIAIPYAGDMFECSHMFVPVTTHSTALQCQKEISQILSIIDIVKLYNRPMNSENNV